MVNREEILIELINWSYQGVLTWLGIGLASVIGVIEIRIKRLKSIYFFLYVGLLFSVLISLNKILDKWNCILFWKGELRNTYHWDIGETVNRPFSKLLNSLLILLMNNDCIEWLLVIIIIIFGIEILCEKINGVSIFYYFKTRIQDKTNFQISSEENTNKCECKNEALEISNKSINVKNENNLSENLMKYNDILWNLLIHNENLLHAIFYTLTALNIGIWTISFQYFKKCIKAVALTFSIFLSYAGFELTYQFQFGNDVIHVILNKIRKKVCLQEMTVNINDKEVRIFPEEWDKYELKQIKDMGMKSRIGIEATGKKSWWAIYKLMFLLMLLISILFSVLEWVKIICLF